MDAWWHPTDCVKQQVGRKPGTDAAMTKSSGGRPLRQENEVVTMAAQLTDRQKKKILADYVQTNNYCATAKINGVSATTVKNLVRANADIVEKCEQKKEENTIDAYSSFLVICKEAGDVVSARLFERIIDEEQAHLTYYDNIDGHIKKLGDTYLAKIAGTPSTTGPASKGFVTATPAAG